ncbi:O-antigen ligase family protein, partial [Enterococcus faecium]
ERFPLPLNDHAFSNRGFIWSRSLPLLKKTWLLGRGSGAFPFEFPNYDLLAMSQIFGSYALVDKPHSFYLGFAYTHGAFALVLLLSLFATY